MNKENTILTIHHDLYDIHGNLVAKAGDILTDDYIRSLSDSSRYKGRAKKSVEETGIYEDIKESLDQEKYQPVFNHEGIKDEILRIIGSISFNPILFDEFDLMKRRDFYTYRHVLITTALAVRMAMDLYISNDEIHKIGEATLTHDFGKARIPLNILQKTNFLTTDESDFIAEHPTVGYLLLTYYQGKIDSLNSKVAFEHHEKMDGSGYPRGIKEIDPIVELVTANDIYDALISERPYRNETYTMRAAIDHLTKEMDDGKLNETAVSLLVSYNREKSKPTTNINISRNFRGIPPHENFYSPIKRKGNIK